MRVIPHEDIGEFAREVMPWLEHEPVRHNLIATLIAMFAAADQPKGGIRPWTVVDEQGAIAGLAIQTPPTRASGSDHGQVSTISGIGVSAGRLAGSFRVPGFGRRQR
jgi:hypothetical protein